jgi:hypothetical protein
VGEGEGEKGVKAGGGQHARTENARRESGRTGVHPGDVHDRGEEEHDDDAHAKDLDAAAGHVEHEGLHGEGFGGGDGEVPCALFFEGGVGGGGGFGGRPRLVGSSGEAVSGGGDVRGWCGGWKSRAVGGGFSICCS